MTHRSARATVPAAGAKGKPVGKVKIRYLVHKLRGGRALYYWQPAAELRQHGWLPTRLPDDRVAAIAKAEQMNAELDAWRAGTGTVAAGVAPMRHVEPATLAAVIRSYERSRFFTDKAERTKRGYRQNMRFLEDWGGDMRVAAITKKTVETLYTSLYTRTPSKAKAVIVMLQILLEAAIRQELITTNPALKAGLRGAKPSGRLWTREAVDLFVATADAAGWHSVGTAVRINHWLGQRETDILALPRAAVANNRTMVLQSKTGARVAVPDSPQVRARLDAELAHQERLQAARDAAVRARGAIPLPADPPATLLLCEGTGEPWTEHYFRHVFAEIRATMAKAHPVTVHADGTEVETAKLWFMHLRHTAVTEMAVAGCTTLQIAGVTGHSIASVNQILARYVSLTAELAAAATTKRLAHEEARQAKQEGIAS
jgi:hypothetical protein